MKLLTADLPGTGGIYKQEAQDFQVEEIPLYPCSGVGEHLYLWIEKEGISTHELLNQLKKELRIKDREIGYAGLKDARARTRQMISVPARCEKKLQQARLRQATIINSNRHGNKLRLGHLAGNRFSIRLRNVGPDGAKRAQAILDVLASTGVPNRFGEQRYGLLGNSANLGLLLLQENYQAFCRELLGDPALIRNTQWQAAATAYRAENLSRCLELLPQRMRDERRLVQALMAGKSHQQAALSLPRNLLRLYLSACQSQLFDQLLENRLPNLDQLFDGDIAYKHENGACFRVESAKIEQPRAERFEISPTAPLFGFKAMQAEQKPGADEKECLTNAGLSYESWRLKEGLAMPGERRPLRAPIQNINLSQPAENQLLLEFSLPKGSYATSVLAEIIK
ncbi:tRNA pseudouridine13 synthase [Malonomonas rubra DSM 5091]|uniref:tRNA pseudouridine synthase D n=1 Tax=Malonomonas rubra DSM 5091 TaxID=1122189 RepID=A0A1M6IAB6_MALRU|nr:tRNA pseudouridine(13) synthase TruD [Malonomonas rubra]SHJ31362.1 tRNA pseudouridine13 synthase [Malonomonas rubra DSM 5091]